MPASGSRGGGGGERGGNRSAFSSEVDTGSREENALL